MDELHSDHLDELKALLAVAVRGSLVAAGRVLGRHAAVVTKRIAAL